MSRWQEGGKKSPVARAAHQGIAALFSIGRSVSGAGPAPAAPARARRWGEIGGRLWKGAEVDHRVPLFWAWSKFRDTPWPKLLDYWGSPNLQAINRDANAAKCATEARGRYAARYLVNEPA